MSTRLIVIGAGAQARYILNTVELTGAYEVLGLVDTFNNPSMWGKEVDGVRVLGGLEALSDYPPQTDLMVICAIANAETKRHVAADLQQRGYAFANVIHPSVQMAHRVRLGVGIIINAGVIIETGVMIGNHVIIHAGCVVEHDNVLADFVNLGPGVTTAGRVHIEEGAIIYSGATIIPDIVVGEDAVVGAGAVVISDVPPRVTVVGVPARRIQRKEGIA